MTTSTTQQQVPSSGETLSTYGTEHYAVTVQRARRVLQILFWSIIVTCLVTALISFLAVTDTLGRYQKIVADSATSANAAQEARSALLAYHSAAADFLSLKSSSNDEEATKALQDSVREWQDYQDALRRFWRNKEEKQSDRLFGENEVFKAADNATWRYKADIDAMLALVEIANGEAAERLFLQGDQTLRREVVPALNGLENLKLESMEDAYATTNSAISTWRQLLMVIGGAAVLLLVIGFVLTRFWLHYAWTWELAIASLVAIILFGWFNITLIRAAEQAEVLVRHAYDTLSGIQTIEALLTQTEAAESLAVFNAQQALISDENSPEKATSYRVGSHNFLSDTDAYLFLLEQRLCGEPQLPDGESCIDQSFGSETKISPTANDIALDGQKKYGLRRKPLTANAFSNNFIGEARELEKLREVIQRYKQANQQLQIAIESQQAISPDLLKESKEAYLTAMNISSDEQNIVRGEFDKIYQTVALTMGINWWLAFIFSVLGVLGAWGIRRRRQALFAL